jgi:acyl-CoA synthetase (AMP-forming)/AMP-acid ligase II
VAIGLRDERLGQAIVVVARGDSAREVELRMRLRRELPSFQQPLRYVWLTALPRNANGKLDRIAIVQTVLPELVEGRAPNDPLGARASTSSARTV